MKPLTLGERIEAARKKRKMTREAVAEELGTSPPNVRAWLKGFCSPRPEMQDRIEKWLKNGGPK